MVKTCQDSYRSEITRENHAFAKVKAKANQNNGCIDPENTQVGRNKIEIQHQATYPIARPMM